MLEKIKQFFKTRAIGFYLSFVCIFLLFLQLVSYISVPNDVFNIDTIISLIIGLILAIGSLIVGSLLSMFFNYRTSLVPVITMVFSFLSLVFISRAEGAIDYFSTQFFSGLTLSAILGLPFSFILTVISLVLCFVLSSVVMYLPQVRETKGKGE